MTTIRYLRVDGAAGLVGSEVPYLEYGSADRGPTICLMAGVHGCEYSSILGLRRFLADLDEAELAGRILAIPIANLAAFERRTPFVVPHDGKNLNRAFPGDPAGTFTDRLAFELFEHVISTSDFLIDMHAGDQVEALEPFTIFESSAVEQRARELAHAYGLRYSLCTKATGSPIAGTSSAAAAQIGIPAITAEAGGCGLVDEASVALHLTGVRRVLATLGILDETPEHIDPPVELDRWVWLRAEGPGWWSPSVAPGEHVEGGEVLGTVSSLFGTEVSPVVAPESGVPLFVTSSPAVAADGLLLGLGVD